MLPPPPLPVSPHSPHTLILPPPASIRIPCRCRRTACPLGSSSAATGSTAACATTTRPRPSGPPSRMRPSPPLTRRRQRRLRGRPPPLQRRAAPPAANARLVRRSRRGWGGCVPPPHYPAAAPLSHRPTVPPPSHRCSPAPAAQACPSVRSFLLALFFYVILLRPWALLSAACFFVLLIVNSSPPCFLFRPRAFSSGRMVSLPAGWFLVRPLPVRRFLLPPPDRFRGGPRRALQSAGHAPTNSSGEADAERTGFMHSTLALDVVKTAIPVVARTTHQTRAPAYARRCASMRGCPSL